MIKCVLFLRKGSNAKKIALQYDIASLIYALYAQSNHLTIREDNLHLHATYHAQFIVFLEMDWIKSI